MLGLLVVSRRIVFISFKVIDMHLYNQGFGCAHCLLCLPKIFGHFKIS